MSDESTTIKQEIDKIEGDKEKPKQAVTPEQDPLWKRIIWADSPKKDLTSYSGHPMNYDNSNSTARIIRGMEGIAGSLDKAVIDILVGIIEKVSGAFSTAQRQRGRE